MMYALFMIAAISGNPANNTGAVGTPVFVHKYTNKNDCQQAVKDADVTANKAGDGSALPATVTFVCVWVDQG